MEPPNIEAPRSARLPRLYCRLFGHALRVPIGFSPIWCTRCGSEYLWEKGWKAPKATYIDACPPSCECEGGEE